MSNAADAQSATPPTRWYKRITLSLSAFIMSLAMTLINAFYSVQGSEIVVQAPEHILLYRDGEGDQAVLSMAVRLPMINAASGHGDLLLESSIQPGSAPAKLQYQSLITPAFTQAAEEAAGKCALGTRCIPLPGLLIMEQEDEIVDVPAGAAKSRYFAYTAAEWNCSGEGAACKSWSDFNTALASVTAKPLDVRIHLKFNQDGAREIRCRGSKVDAEYLRKIGWVNVPCERSEVGGEPLL